MPAARSPGLKVRTPAFQAGGIGFKSHGDHHVKVRTPASQAGNVGFKSHRSYCGYRTVVVKRTQFALQICGSAPTEAERRPIPPGHIMDGYA